MPGFMQSFKSPFNPNKKNATVIAPAVVVAPAEEGTIAEEQPSPEVLPGEALVQQTSSTVALTLTPVTGESSQQLASDNAEVTPPEAPIAQSELPIQSESVPEEISSPAQPTEPQSEATPTEAAQDSPEEATLQPAVFESDAAAVEPSSDLAQEVVPSSEPEAVAPQAPIESDAASPSEEPACAVVTDEASNDVAPTSTDGEASKPAAKANKEGFSCNIKRNKSKKQKADASPEVTEAGQSVSPKPRKSHPLTDKFRSVIEQVKSKVKKDKEAGLTPPAVEAVEPTPIVEEVAATA